MCMNLKRPKGKKREINTVDLFCGAGGATTGLEVALSRLGMTHKGIAINHWQVAVDTMKLNHKDVDTKQMSIEAAVPADLVPSGVVDILWASPSCTHHSRAKGGKPRSNQLRAQPELVLTWLDQLYVKRLIVENVPEFVDWGPLNKDGTPNKRMKGECFRAWVRSIEARGYLVEWRIVNCADYGDATSRRRFFLKAVKKGCGKIRWPEPKYAENPETDLFGNTKLPWRGIKDCLDFSDLGTSIFNRKKPLAKNTLRRIAVGLKKYCGLEFQMDMFGSNEGDEHRIRPLDKPMATQHAGGNRTAIVRPFIVKLRNTETAQGVEEPLSTVSAGGQHHMLCQPFIFTEQSNNAPRSVDKPIRAQTTVRKDYLCQPFIVKMRSNATVGSVEEPLTTISSNPTHYLCQPLVVAHTKNGKAQPTSKPIGAVTTKDHFSVVQALVMDHFKGGEAVPTDKPIGAQTTHARYSLVTPMVLGQHGAAQCHPVDKPCPTIATKGAIRAIFPVVVDTSFPKANDDHHVMSGDDPINTIVTKNTKIVAFPQLEDGRLIDIYIRMLKPEELAAAHSFPKDYVLTGTRTDQVKQIGNSVPVMTAAAMCEVDLEAKESKNVA